MATIIALRDFRVLERYRYTIALAGLALLLLPRVPGIGQQVNGAYLGVKLGPISFQPAEFGKIAIVIFLAAYLRDTRAGAGPVLAALPRGDDPALKHFGPLLVVWGAAMLMLVFIRDLGSSLMYFGAFLALIYVATNRLSFVVVGLAAVRRRRVVLRRRPSATCRTASTSGWTRSRGYDARRATRSPTGCSRMADGGLFGQGLGAALLNLPDGGAADPGARRPT